MRRRKRLTTSRAWETTTEYNLRMARTRKDRDALREALRDAQDKAHRDALNNLDQTIKDQKARAERARQARCDRLSQRASTERLDTNRASRRYQAECD
jgi:hypothetical protein